MLEKRSVATVIILSIITCGIYSLYWYYVTIKALDEEGNASNMTTTWQFILMFLYVGTIIFALNANSNINSIKQKRGMKTEDNTLPWLILSIFIPIVTMALVQAEINHLVDTKTAF